MSECTHQTQDTREKAKVRLDRYLAMARQRMKARHQREKLEKKKRLVPGGVTSRGNGRQSSADRGTPEPSVVLNFVYPQQSLSSLTSLSLLFRFIRGHPDIQSRKRSIIRNWLLSLWMKICAPFLSNLARRKEMPLSKAKLACE